MKVILNIWVVIPMLILPLLFIGAIILAYLYDYSKNKKLIIQITRILVKFILIILLIILVYELVTLMISLVR
ncbi:MAG: hypothetical protein Q8K70_08545 [Bacteroidota bacterium]|nr:hypothetical protein [Bacteroidota bacterium]